jgi:hypothetical protein
MRTSKLTLEKKQRELLLLKKMTPQQRLNAQARLNVRVKKLFFAGLSSRGFDREEIIRLWKAR